MTASILTRHSYCRTGRRQNRKTIGVFFSLTLFFLTHLAASVSADETFTPIDPDTECSGPTEHPICAIKTFVECSRAPLELTCAKVGLVYDDKTRALLSSRKGLARERPWTLTFAEAHGEGYDYTFFGQRSVTHERFSGVNKKFRLPTPPLLEVRVKGCGIAADCSNDAWSYFLKKDDNPTAKHTWRVVGESHWQNSSAARTCRRQKDPFFKQTYCGHYIHGLVQ